MRSFAFGNANRGHVPCGDSLVTPLQRHASPQGWLQTPLVVEDGNAGENQGRRILAVPQCLIESHLCILLGSDLGHADGNPEGQQWQWWNYLGFKGTYK